MMGLVPTVSAPAFAWDLAWDFAWDGGGSLSFLQRRSELCLAVTIANPAANQPIVIRSFTYHTPVPLSVPPKLLLLSLSL